MKWRKIFLAFLLSLGGAAGHAVAEDHIIFGESDQELRVGTLKSLGGKADVIWATLQDWESATM